MLTDSEKQFFLDMEALFLQPGWARMVSEWQKEMNQIPLDAFLNAGSDRDLEIARVRYNLMREMIELPQGIAAQKENLELQRAAESDPDLTAYDDSV